MKATLLIPFLNYYIIDIVIKIEVSSDIEHLTLSSDNMVKISFFLKQFRIAKRN